MMMMMTTMRMTMEDEKRGERKREAIDKDRPRRARSSFVIVEVR
jgi:hypothetical protein